MIAGESGNLARFVRKKIERPPRAATATIQVETAWFTALAIEEWRLSFGGERPQNRLDPKRWRKSGSTKRAFTRPSGPTTSVAGIGSSQPPLR